MSKKKYMKLMTPSPLKNASRNKREMDAAYEAGFDIVLVCGPVGQKDLTNEIGRYQIHSWKPVENGLKNSRVGRIALFVLNKFYLSLFARYQILKHKPDVISCEDLRNLKVAYDFTRFWKKKPQLIYDSHEFEIGRRGSRTPEQQKKIMRLESFLMNQSAFSIVVNDSIADEIVQEYNLQQRPLVIRSTPPKWELDSEVIQARRAAYCLALNLENDAFIALYHGNVLSERGIEQLIEAVSRNSKLHAVILGDAVGGLEYLQSLKNLCAELGVENRVLFHPGVPIDELWQYVAAADVGFVLIENSCKSYYLSLPNKFMECIQSLLPIICSDFPEMRRLVDEYNIGLYCDPEDKQSIDVCLERIRTDSELNKRFRNGLIRAKEALSWETEKIKLLEAFQNCLQ